MFVIIKCQDRCIENCGTADTKKEAQDMIYKELCDVYDTEGDLIDAIHMDDADFQPERLSAWSNHEGWIDIKALWV